MGSGEQRPDAAYTYNPVWRWLQSEWHIILIVVLVSGAVVGYRAIFPQTVIANDRLPKYLRVLKDFDSLAGNLEQTKDIELRKKAEGGVGAVDASGPKMALYLIWDYMFVSEMRPDSPFYAGYPKAEKELIATLISVGNTVDAFLIRLADSAGNPEAEVDFGRIRRDLKKAWTIYEAEAGRRSEK
ncbi:MAG: hypothetical protein HY897_14475 [Deltaproteobacteria bacterium]|nr:hypothetical protein [Deltaproteobacteria bacterium]